MSAVEDFADIADRMKMLEAERNCPRVPEDSAKDQAALDTIAGKSFAQVWARYFSGVPS
jgi:hypothetical protein